MLLLLRKLQQNAETKQPSKTRPRTKSVGFYIFHKQRIMIFNNLPLYEAKINNEEMGMYAISFVDDPATESEWLAFSKEAVNFSIADEEQRMVFGLIMPANRPIYRRAASGYEYYLFFRPETLREMVEKYLADGFQNNVDRNHDNMPVEDVQMTQIFIKDDEKGISPKGFEMYENGSVFGQFHVLNDEVWGQIKDGSFHGFSLAGIFEVKETEFSNQNNNIKNRISMKIEKIKAALRKILAEFGSVSTDKGVLVWDGDEDLKEGDAVRSMDEEGNDVEVEDGVYHTEDGKLITVEGGKVVKIEDDEAEVAPEEPAAEEPAEGPVEEIAEEPAEEPEADDRDERIANLEAEIARLEEENGALRERIKELEGESAAEPADETFSKSEQEMGPKEKALKNRGYRF